MAPPSTANGVELSEEEKRPRPLGIGRVGEEALTMSRIGIVVDLAILGHIIIRNNNSPVHEP